jgi:hypothetical protein
MSVIQPVGIYLAGIISFFKLKTTLKGLPGNKGFPYALIQWFFIGYWINTGFDFYLGPFFLPYTE